MTGQGRRGSRGAVIVGIVAVFLAGMAASTVLLGSGRSDGAPAPATPQLTDPPASMSSRPADSPAPGEQGAIDAALELATASQTWLYLADEDLEAEVRAVATEASADVLVDDTLAEVGLVRDALAQSSGRIWWIVRPLAWKVESIRAGRATVSVWTVSVLSASGIAVPQADWMTVTLDLVWERDAWRLHGSRETPGPTPQLGGRDTAWEPVPFDEALEGFQRVGPGDQ